MSEKPFPPEGNSDEAADAMYEMRMQQAKKREGDKTPTEKQAEGLLLEKAKKERKTQKEIKPDGSNHPENKVYPEAEKLDIDRNQAVEEANDIVFKRNDQLNALHDAEKIVNDKIDNEKKVINDAENIVSAKMDKEIDQIDISEDRGVIDNNDKFKEGKINLN